MSTAKVTKLPVPDAALEAFPEVPCGHQPFGQYVIVQLRLSKKVSAGGILLTDYDQDTEKDNTQVAKVVAIGSGAFKRRSDGEPWPEGVWFKVGDFVRCPKYGGDRWTVKGQIPEIRRATTTVPARIEPVEFAMFKELDCRAGVDDPMGVKVVF